MGNSMIQNPNMIGGHYFAVDYVKAVSTSNITLNNNVRCLISMVNNVGLAYLGLLFTDNSGTVGVHEIFNQGNHAGITSNAANTITISNNTAKYADISFMYF